VGSLAAESLDRRDVVGQGQWRIVDQRQIARVQDDWNDERADRAVQVVELILKAPPQFRRNDQAERKVRKNQAAG